jgi:hypothetical protein
MLQSALRAKTIQELRTCLGTVPLRGKDFPVAPAPDELEAWLSGRGFGRGALVECLAESEGQGAETLALIVAGRMIRSGGMLVVLDDQRTFYAPVALALGIDPEAIVVLRPAQAADSLWALEQTLRSPGIKAVICRLNRLSDQGMQRLKRAAEIGGGLGFLLRPFSAGSSPSWAEMRLSVRGVSCQSQGWRLRVEVLKSQRGLIGKTVEVEIDHETGDLRPVPRVASPTAVIAKTGT